MNYNFTNHVRTGLQRAREEAIRLRRSQIETEHILLGILPEKEVGEILRALVVDPEEIRRAVESRSPRGNAPLREGELPYSRGAKKVLELSITEARQLKGTYVGTEHLLLGVLAEERGIGAEVLRHFGITSESVRSRRPASQAKPPEAFRIRIDDSSDRSIYEQIVARITEAVATGELRPGERLSTVRQLADDLDIAPGTVARAYGELESRGLVVTEGTRGTRVADPPASPLREPERSETLAGLLRPVAVAAFHLGATAKELRAALEEAMRGIFDKRDHAA